jgi:ABC-type multidrug transport system ATPase subunit
MTAVLKVEGLTKSFDSVFAAEDISFSVEPGEALALLGPNGSGKTTTLRCVTGLLKPDAGDVKVCGLDLFRDLREARRRFSYLPQQAVFPPNLTVRETLEFHARLRNLDPDKITAARREAGISDLDVERVVGELSMGMRQRLSFAVAAAPSVPLTLLDEPTAGLDPEASLRLRKLARRWKSEGRALLFSTHVLDDVEELADRVLVLVEGRPVVEEEVAALQATIRRSALLRVNVGKPSEAHQSAALAMGALDVHLNRHSLVIEAPIEKRYPILQKLGEVGPVHYFEMEAPSIEQVYLNYVRKGERVS